jgi:hypothetical protein
MSLENDLTRRAWSDGAFAARLAATPDVALAELGVTVPEGMRLEVRLQRRDTLYYVIPPFNPSGDPNTVVNQMDLWRTADQFVWIMPEGAKVGLLQMRRQHRSWAEQAKAGRYGA